MKPLKPTKLLSRSLLSLPTIALLQMSDHSIVAVMDQSGHTIVANMSQSEPSIVGSQGDIVI